MLFVSGFFIHNQETFRFLWNMEADLNWYQEILQIMLRTCPTPKKRCKHGKQQPFQILAITAFSNFWQNNGFLKFWQTTAFSHLGKLPFQILATNSHFTSWQTAFPNPGKWQPFYILANCLSESWLIMAYSNPGKQLPWQTTALISFFCLVGTWRVNHYCIHHEDRPRSDTPQFQ